MISFFYYYSEISHQFLKQMNLIRISCLLLLFVSLVDRSIAAEHIVGDSIWTIPPNDDFYTNWSRNRTFTAGDTLVFKFETGFYNVVQVSRREFESCSAENAFRSFTEGPVAVSLNQDVYYFICSFGNYCFLGQKVSVSVQRRN